MRGLINLGLVFSLLLLISCGEKIDKKEIDTVSTNKIDTVSGKIASDLSSKYIKKELETLPTSLLELLKKKRDERKNYVSGSYAEKKLNELVLEKGLNKNKRLQREISSLRNKVYINELVNIALKESEQDIESLAKDKYALNKNEYRTRRRIRIAQIFISKYGRKREKAKEIIDKVYERLKGKEANTFFDLADEFTEDKKNASRGGVYDKWLIYPEDANKLSKVLVAAFNLKKVGDITDIIETWQGFHIIKLIANNPSQQNTFESVKDVLIEEVKRKVFSSVKEEVNKSLNPEGGVDYKDDLLLKMIEDELSKRNLNKK